MLSLRGGGEQNRGKSKYRFDVQSRCHMKRNSDQMSDVHITQKHLIECFIKFLASLLEKISDCHKVAEL